MVLYSFSAVFMPKKGLTKDSDAAPVNKSLEPVGQMKEFIMLLYFDSVAKLNDLATLHDYSAQITSLRVYQCNKDKVANRIRDDTRY